MNIPKQFVYVHTKKAEEFMKSHSTYFGADVQESDKYYDKIIFVEGYGIVTHGMLFSMAPARSEKANTEKSYII